MSAKRKLVPGTRIKTVGRVKFDKNAVLPAGSLATFTGYTPSGRPTFKFEQWHRPLSFSRLAFEFVDG